METDKIAVIGFYVDEDILSQASKEEIIAYTSDKKDIYGRMLYTLGDYLTKYSKKFDRVSFHFTDQVNRAFPNGTLAGIMGMVNRSEIDIGVQPVTMNEEITQVVDFSYPYKLYSTTFVTRKPDYKPQIFGIFQTFSLTLWITIISVLIAMSFVYYVTLKRRYSFDKILLHVLAVLLRQSSILKPSSVIENVLVFSWVIGAMYICMAYDSVFLSFLAFPPITQVKDVPQLAKAVKKGQYYCIAIPQSAIFEKLLKSKEENLQIIGQDLNTNNLSNGNAIADFILDSSKLDLAFLVDTAVVDILSVGKKFVSEDTFDESMGAMFVRKDFCCKKLMEKFAHTFMASGLYFKYKNDASFLIRMPRLLHYEEKDTSKRVLTLTDVAPAFIFLLFGHILSFVVLIVEIMSSRMKKVDRLKENNKRGIIIAYEEDLM